MSEGGSGCKKLQKKSNRCLQKTQGNLSGGEKLWQSMFRLWGEREGGGKACQKSRYLYLKERSYYQSVCLPVGCAFSIVERETGGSMK